MCPIVISLQVASSIFLSVKDFADIIAGFPTETEEDFDETISLCDKYKFPSLFMNQFFPRPGTPAAKWEQIPRQVIKERTKKLSNVFKR